MVEFENKKTYGIVANPQNKKLIANLKKNGEEVLIFPAIETLKQPLTADRAAIFQSINGYDWIVFTDVFAADFFIELMRDAGTDFFELDNLTVGALGESVVDRLRFVQVHADVIPAGTDDEAVFSAFAEYAAGDLEGSKFLVVVETHAVHGFGERLRANGAIVEYFPVYQRRLVADPEIVKLKALLRGGAVDELVFSTAEDLICLVVLNGETDIRKVLNETKISATTEIAFQTLREYGLRPLYFHAR